jgi:hypothetical protein
MNQEHKPARYVLPISTVALTRKAHTGEASITGNATESLRA